MTRYLSLPLACGLVLALGCTSDPAPQDPVSRTDLRQVFQRPSVSAVGVGLLPSGARVVFDEQAGLFRLNADGSVTQLMAVDSLPPTDVPVRYPFTDLVALAENEFAVTAIGDGYLLDVSAPSLKQHFCYVPDALPDDEDQRTDAVGFDSERQLLIAQPQTYDFDGNIIGSQIARYDRVTGTDLEWYTLPDPEFLAGGMVMDTDGTLLLGERDRLYRFDFDTQQLTVHADLSRYGISRVDGLAMDVQAGLLVVVDNDRDELIELDLAELNL